MKLVNFQDAGQVRLGLLSNSDIIDPLAALPASDPARPHFAGTLAFIKAGEAGLAAARRVLKEAPAAARRPAAGVKLTAPILPSTILCSGSNYRAHNAEKANTPISGKEPEFFVMTADNVIGPDEAIVYDPSYTKKLDCETELAIVIGKAGRHIPRERALEHVFGYTIVNDVTARDLQVRKSPEGSVWYEVGRGKVFDTSAPLGPVIVTADEIPDPQALDLRTRINGELRQHSSTSDMIFSCVDLIHFFSMGSTLKPGMVIITGTPGGTAWSNDEALGGKWQALPGLVRATRYCLPGDVVESEVEKIGVLRNPIVHI
ncbi:MAG: fumarylacetoacetate hydrolase family protein [Variibacter sp.]|nr:fumarylacetoacetate hydrolase family protein [Variibacter sp.]